VQNIENKPGCIKSALAILGDKWSPLLLKELAGDEAKTFTDLETLLVGISPRTLSQRLEKLIEAGILKKTEYCAHPPRYDYRLTDKGHELDTILRAMAKWGEKHYSA
jgi:DNA-binding HxlR family transcriptional regulator